MAYGSDGLGFKGDITGYKLVHFPCIANETFTKQWEPCQIYGANCSMRPPQNATAECHGIVQGNPETGQSCDVVIYGLTRFRSNGTVYFGDTMINYSSGGRRGLKTIGNITKHSFRALGRSMRTMDNLNVSKIGIMMFWPNNET